MAVLEPRTVRLKTGEDALIRSAEAADAEALVALGKAVAVDAEWTVTTPEEFDFTPEQERKWIAGHAEAPGRLAIVPVVDGEVVGVLDFESGTRARVAHRGSFGVSVAAAWRGRGVGDALVRTLLEWAAAHPTIEKVELAVMEGNAPAVALYRKHGFVVEGRRPRHVRYAPDRYEADLLMYRFVK